MKGGWFNCTRTIAAGRERVDEKSLQDFLDRIGKEAGVAWVVSEDESTSPRTPAEIMGWSVC